MSELLGSKPPSSAFPLTDMPLQRVVGLVVSGALQHRTVICSMVTQRRGETAMIRNVLTAKPALATRCHDASGHFTKYGIPGAKPTRGWRR